MFTLHWVESIPSGESTGLRVRDLHCDPGRRPGDSGQVSSPPPPPCLSVPGRSSDRRALVLTRTPGALPAPLQELRAGARNPARGWLFQHFWASIQSLFFTLLQAATWKKKKEETSVLIALFKRLAGAALVGVVQWKERRPAD